MKRDSFKDVFEETFGNLPDNHSTEYLWTAIAATTQQNLRNYLYYQIRKTDMTLRLYESLNVLKRLLLRVVHF